MTALATLDQYEARGGDISNEDRAEAAIDDAGAAIRAYTGQEFDLVEDDEVRLRVTGGTVRLPQRPVTAVSAVTTTDGSAVTFSWYAGEVVTLGGSGQLLNEWEIEPFRSGRDLWVDVTYSHGYTEVPADIVAVCCNMAATTVARGSSLGVTQESAGPFSQSFSTSSPFSLGTPERSTLDRYRRPIGLIRVGP